MVITNETSLKWTRSVLALSIGVFAPLALAGQTETEVSGVQEQDAENRSGRAVNNVARSPREPVRVRGVSHTVDSSAEPNSYQVYAGGQLNVTRGAVVDNISASRSRVDIDSARVRDGMTLFQSVANISNGTITNSGGVGLMLQMFPQEPTVQSVAVVRDSRIQGASYGVLVSAAGDLTLERSQVEGIGSEALGYNGGLSLVGGVARILDGSHVTGEDSGVRISNGTHGYVGQRNRLEVNASTLSARSGAAIEVSPLRGMEGHLTSADILIANHSVLEAGNNRLVDVRQQSSAKVEVNNSRLTGDLVADDSSTLNVTLRNHARLNGNIINGNELIIDSSGHWQLAGDNAVKSLAIDGGSVGFSGDEFHTLTLGQLSGRGVFDMRINLDNGTGDLLNVDGQATGRHLLNVRNTGVEGVPGTFEALRVVHTEGGDAQFRLKGGRVDLGAYSYALEQQGNDWFIVGSGKIISPSTQSVLALFNVGPTLWNSELKTLRSRMGEVRGQEGGGWMTAYGNRFKALLDSGVNYRQKQQGLSFGADTPVPVSEGHLLLGVMGGYSQSGLDLSRGTSGKVGSYYIGAYGTWLSDDGYYLDGVLKLNRFQNASRVAMSDGEKAKGNYNNMALGGSLEVGRHIKLSDEYFVEPFAQLSSVWIEGDSYTLDNGLTAKNKQTQSILGKVGATVGRPFVLKDGGIVQPYVRVAAAHEFSRSNDVSVNGQRFDNDLFGSRAELGAGVSVALSTRLQVHADFDYMKGDHVEQPWGANVGVRLAF